MGSKFMEEGDSGVVMADAVQGTSGAAADQSALDAGWVDNAASVPSPMGSDLAAGQVVSQLHWWGS